jgi:hypothetical protein
MYSAYVLIAAFVANVAVKVFAASEGQNWL